MFCVARSLRHALRLRNVKPFVISPRRVHTDYDECGIPSEPTWSVQALLSSYPIPTLSSATLKRLHELSALLPPPEGTPEFMTLKEEMEEFIRLVEAVKIVDLQGVRSATYFRQRDAEDAQSTQARTAEKEVDRRQLLVHADRTHDGFYVVDVQRRY